MPPTVEKRWRKGEDDEDEGKIEEEGRKEFLYLIDSLLQYRRGKKGHRMALYDANPNTKREELT